MKYQSFKMPSSGAIPGIGRKELLAFFAVVIVGLVLFELTGMPQKQIERQRTDAAIAADMAALEHARNVLWSEECRQSGLNPSMEQENCDAKAVYYDEIALAEAREKSEEMGFNASSDDAFLKTLVPVSEIKQTEMFSAAGRAALFLLGPLAFLIGLCVEFEQGTNLRGEIARIVKKKSKRVVYGYEPLIVWKAEEE